MRISGPNKRQAMRMKPLLRAQILDAQKNTLSAAAAARYLQVSYSTYKKYAKLYGVFEQHVNQVGKGISKGGVGRHGISLHRIFSNEFPNYSLTRLKSRLIARRILPEECEMCKFSEKRVSDNKCPLLLTFKNGERDFAKDNLILLCYNCMFLTTGVPVVAHKNHITNTLNKYNSGKTVNTYVEKPQEKDLLKYEPKEEFEKQENIEDLDIKTIQEEAMRELEE